MPNPFQINIMCKLLPVDSQTTNVAPGKMSQNRKHPVLPVFSFFSFMKHVVQASDQCAIYFHFNLASAQFTMMFITYLKKQKIH